MPIRIIFGSFDHYFIKLQRSQEHDMRRQVKRICGNCRLYDGKSGTCRVVILASSLTKAVLKEIGGSSDGRVHLPVLPEDPCFFEGTFSTGGESFVPADEIQQVRFWVEDPKTGQKTDGNGVVRMECPEGFFGNANGPNDRPC